MLLPLVVREPFGILGLFGGKDHEIISLRTNLFVFYVVASIVMMFAVWNCTLAFLKDYWSIRGSLADQRYCFVLGPDSTYVIGPVVGNGLSFFKATLKQVETVASDAAAIETIEIRRHGTASTTISQVAMEQTDGLASCDFVSPLRGPWKMELLINSTHDPQYPVERELVLYAISASGNEVSLPSVGSPIAVP